MLLEGSTRADIEEAAPQLFPGMNVAKLLDHAIQLFAEAACQPTDVVGGWCLESSRDLYRKMVEVGDYDGALRAVKQVTEVVKFVQGQRDRTVRVKGGGVTADFKPPSTASFNKAPSF